MVAFGKTGLAIAVLALGLVAPAHAGGDDNAGADAFGPCAACHMADGTGAPGLFPPLTGRLGGLAVSNAGRDYLVMVVKAGLMGALEIGGVSYQGVMPPQGTALDDASIAALLNYLMMELNRNDLPEDWGPFSAEEVTAIAARHPGANPMSVYKLRGPAFAHAKGK